ncbi:MAG: type II secretion system protein [Planctomycetota bacterium]|nr:type II secretion system protein [Planctomycetota bacterium]
MENENIMNYELKNKGFSLTEVLMAIGIFSVAMIFIAGAFPVAIHFTTIASEQTIAAVVADEAFAKIRLYGVNPLDPNMQSGRTIQVPFENVKVTDINPNEFAYPSDPAVDISQKQYYWSAICRRVGNIGSRDVQVTVFVSRKIGTGTTYYVRDDYANWTNWPGLVTVDYPAAVPVGVQAGGVNDEIVITDLDLPIDPHEETFVNDGYTIVEDSTGQVYRVLQRYGAPAGTVQLDKVWNANGTYPLTTYVWVIPPPATGGRYPCVGVFQKVIRF